MQPDIITELTAMRSRLDSLICSVQAGVLSHEAPSYRTGLSREAHEDIITLCDALSISESVLCGPVRTQSISFRRSVIHYMLAKRYRGRLSYSELGSLVNRDHTTVRASYYRVKSQLDIGDKAVTALVDTATEVFQS